MNKLDCLVYLNIRVKEEWKICARNNNYAVSNLGKVKRIKTGRILKQPLNDKGYPRICLYENGIVKSFYVHRLIAEAFVGLCPKRKQVNHIDGDKTNPSYLNLEYVTPKQNMRHAVENDLLNEKKGEKNGHSKLNKKDIIKIMKLRLENLTCNEIAYKFGITKTHVSRILRGKSWSHI